MGVRPEIPGLMGAVKRSASARAGLVDLTAPSGGEMRAPPIHEGEYRPVIEEHAPVPGATGPLAGGAGQLYHDRRANSAAIGVRREVDAVLCTLKCLMPKSRACPPGRPG